MVKLPLSGSLDNEIQEFSLNCSPFYEACLGVEIFVGQALHLATRLSQVLVYGSIYHDGLTKETSWLQYPVIQFLIK